MSQANWSFNHVSILVNDTQQALSFYHQILGIEIETSRPELNVKGAWLKIGSKQIHLLEIAGANPKDITDNYGGRNPHFAMNVDNLDWVMGQLSVAEVPFKLSQSGRKALFCQDFDGNFVEIVQN